MSLSVKEASDLLSVSEKTIYRWIASNNIPFHKVGGQYRFFRHELLQWAGASRLKISPELLKESETSEGDNMLASAIERGGIFYKVEGNTPVEVIRNLVAFMPIPDNVDRNYILEAVTVRESLAPTGIGESIAVPHMRFPYPQMEKSQVTLGFLSRPLNWGAIDAKPVQVVFLPCCPNMRSHLNLLMKIAYLGKEKPLLDFLLSEPLRGELIERFRELDVKIKTK